MTDKEIIKALECCLAKENCEVVSCEKCPLEKRYECTDIMFHETIDLINRQKAENEDLFYKLTGVMHYVDKWLDGDELKQDEVNRAMIMREKTLQIVENLETELKAMRGAANSYKSEVERLQEKYDRTMYSLKAVLDERADHTEAIKEVLEKLKEKYANYKPYETLYAHYIWNDIDKLLKRSHIE